MKKELIDRIVEREEHEHFTLKQILEEELPDFNPYRIDEERITNMWESKFGSTYLSSVQKLIQDYNSTLPEGLKPLPNLMPDWFGEWVDNEEIKAMTFWKEVIKRYGVPSSDLKPLPKEMPEWFDKKVSEWMNNSNIRLNQVWHELISRYGTPSSDLQPLPKEMPEEFSNVLEAPSEQAVWDWVVKYYSTPEPKPSLPSVEVLEKEIREAWRTSGLGDFYEAAAKHIHDKYSLKPREWWRDLKEGDKFMFEGKVRRFQRFVLESRDRYCGLSDCTPYTTPTADEIIKKHNLTEEEVRVIREGKG